MLTLFSYTGFSLALLRFVSESTNGENRLFFMVFMYALLCSIMLCVQGKKYKNIILQKNYQKIIKSGIFKGDTFPPRSKKMSGKVYVFAGLEKN